MRQTVAARQQSRLQSNRTAPRQAGNQRLCVVAAVVPEQLQLQIPLVLEALCLC